MRCRCGSDVKGSVLYEMDASKKINLKIPLNLSAKKYIFSIRNKILVCFSCTIGIHDNNWHFCLYKKQNVV